MANDGLFAGRLALVLLTLAMIARLAVWPIVTNVALMAAALALLGMMRGWQTLTVRRNPLLAALHLAFFWVPVVLGR